MKFLKGIKPALKFPPLWQSNVVEFEITITADMTYDVGDESEQKDFIKITGLSSKRFNNHIWAAILGARYAPESKSWDFVPYYHFNSTTREEFDHVVGKWKGHFNDGDIVTAKVGDMLYGRIEYFEGDKEGWALISDKSYFLVELILNGNLRVHQQHEIEKGNAKFWEVLGWHGGTFASNRSYNFCIKFLRSWLSRLTSKLN